MLGAKDDAVLVVVDVRRVLKVPILVCQIELDSAEVLSPRVIHAPCIAFVLLAKETLRIVSGYHITLLGNVARVFLRLREIDSDLKAAVGVVVRPTEVLSNAIGTDVVCSALRVRKRQWSRLLCFPSYTYPRRCDVPQRENGKRQPINRALKRSR